MNPDNKLPKAGFEINLEALRGFAALLVVWHHITVYDKLNLIDPHYRISGIAAFSPSGHLAVLIFFLLSGYVIGLSTKVPLSNATIGSYLKKRFVRIYPIYFLTVLFALLVAVNHYSWQTILGNFTFLQVIFTNTILEVNPLWSLNYEVLYYLLFIPISYFRISPSLAAAAAFVIGLVNLIMGTPFPLITSYSFGFTFWLLGVVLVQYFRGRPSVHITHTRLISALCLLIALPYFNVILTLFQKVESKSGGYLLYPAGTSWERSAIAFHDFAYLPYCVPILLMFTNKLQKHRYNKLIVAILLLLPLYSFRYVAQSYGKIDLSYIVTPSFAYLGALLLYVMPTGAERLAKKIIKKLVALGSISYGLYIIHFPLFYVMVRLNFFYGTGLTWSIRAFFYLCMCLASAYWLEKKYQFKVRSWIK